MKLKGYFTFAKNANDKIILEKKIFSLSEFSPEMPNKIDADKINLYNDLITHNKYIKELMYDRNSK